MPIFPSDYEIPPFQIRRGTNDKVNDYVAAEGELVYSTNTNQIFIGNGDSVNKLEFLTNISTATSNKLGGVKIGANIAVAADGTISVVAGGGISDQALYTTSSVTFANVYTTASLRVQDMEFSAVGQEDGTIVYRIRTLDPVGPDQDDLQFQEWRFLSLNPTNGVLINEFTPDSSKLSVKTISPINAAPNAVTFAGNIVPDANNTRSLGTSTQKWATLHVNTATIDDLTFFNTNSNVTFSNLTITNTGTFNKINVAPSTDNGLIIESIDNTTMEMIAKSTLFITAGEGGPYGQINLYGDDGGVVIGDGWPFANRQLRVDQLRTINTSSIDISAVAINTATINQLTVNSLATFLGTATVVSPARAIFTATTGASNSVQIWSNSTTASDMNSLRFMRRRTGGSITNTRIGSIDFDVSQPTHGFANDYPANRVFPGIRSRTQIGTASQGVSTTLEFFNRVTTDASGLSPYPFSGVGTGGNTTDTNVIMTLFLDPVQGQTNRGLGYQSLDPYQGYNTFAGTGTALITGIFGINRLGGDTGNTLVLRNGTAGQRTDGVSANLTNQFGFISLRTRSDLIDYQTKTRGGLNTSTQGQISWVINENNPTWATNNNNGPSVVKGSNLSLNTVRYSKLDRSVTQGTTIAGGDLLWNTSTQAGDVLGTISFQGGIIGVSDVTVNDGGVDGVLIRAYAKNNWQGEQTSTTTNITYTGNESALRFEFSTSTTIGPNVINEGIGQRYKTAFEIDATTATFSTDVVAPKVQIGGTVYDTNYVSGIASTATLNVFVFNKTVYNSGKFSVQVKDGTELHFVEISVLTDGTNVWKTEYGTATSNGALGTFTVDVSGDDCRLRFTPSAATNMSIRVSANLLAP